MTGAFAGRDGHEVDALVTDRYLEALLAAHARGADHGPSASAPADPIRVTAGRLARDLPRFHPSFLFEDALAGRLAETAARMARPGRPSSHPDIVALPASGGPGAGRQALATDLQAVGHGRRPLLIGGALTSAAISLAGAAYMAWRHTRPADDAFARAARAVARSRPI